MTFELHVGIGDTQHKQQKYFEKYFTAEIGSNSKP